MMDKITTTYIELENSVYRAVSTHRDGKLIEHEVSYSIVNPTAESAKTA